MPSKAVIIIPSYKSFPNSHETISLLQCVRILGKHPIRLLCPQGMDHSNYEKLANQKIDVDYVSAECMTTRSSYIRLMMDPCFYMKYADYDYILHYQLDAFVFSDELDYWCSQGLDFIGAPWFEGFGTALSKPTHIVGVGNSGFCLRRPKAFLDVLNNLGLHQRLIYRLGRLVWENLITRFPHADCGGAKTTSTLSFFGPDDMFFGLWVPKHFPSFRVASAEQATRFSFEEWPEELHRRNGGNLPFGCHAWHKYNYAFWKPHIEAQGYVLK